MKLDGIMIFLLIVIAIGVGLAVYYYITKAAVKWGILEAKDYKPAAETEANPVHKELKSLYDAGKITFDEYQRKWIEASKPL